MYLYNMGIILGLGSTLKIHNYTMEIQNELHYQKTEIKDIHKDCHTMFK
jgi:hypothetical protein